MHLEICIHFAKKQVYLFTIKACYAIGYIKAFIPKSLSFQRSHGDERL